MPQRSLHEWLIERAYAARSHRVALSDMRGEAPISRRDFLRGSSSVGVALVAAYRKGDEPQIARRGTALLVFFEGSIWTIDQAAFSPRASVSYSDGREASYTIDLRRAVLPGTDFDASFRADLARRHGIWEIRLRMPAHGLDARAPLGDWLRGSAPLSGAVKPQRIRFAGGRFETVGPTRVAVHPHLGLHVLGGTRGVRLQGVVSSHGESLTLDLHAGSDDSLRAVMRGVRSPGTRFTLLAAAPPLDAVHIGRTPAGARIGCCIDGSRAISGELYDAPDGDDGVLLLEGSMRVFTGTVAPAAGDTGQVRLESGAISMALARGRADVALAGRVSRGYQIIEAGESQFTLTGDDEEPVYLRAAAGRVDPPTIRARLVAGAIPVPGATAATLSCPGTAVHVHLSTPPTTAAPAAPAASGRIVLAEIPYAMFKLDGTVITLRRGTDLLNLQFGFSGFDFELRDGSPWLVRHRPEAPGGPWPASAVTVTFPPQHVAETVKDVVNPTACGGTPVPLPARARLSAPSRIVFALDSHPDTAQWTERPLSIESLTEWTDLATHVAPRAMGADAPIGTQLEFAGISPRTPAGDLQAKLAAQMVRPNAAETALVLSSRLTLSPSEGARWDTPKAPLNPKSAPLWQARLGADWRGSVRAIWSEYLREHALTVRGESDPELGLLEPIKHWELVGQSAVYGIPARRRIGPNPGAYPPEQPRSRVLRLEGYDALVKMDECMQAGDAGFAVPTPFSDADIILTSMGGTFVGDWHGEPPNVLTQYGPPKSFQLERIDYRSYLGRDIRVEAVDKGYMFPLGIRCSLVTLVERRFIEHPRRGYPTAYLLRRTFIVFGKPEKNYPGVYQPFDGRDFPARQVTMLTRRSPDLVRDTSPEVEYTDDHIVVRTDGTVVVDGRPDLTVLWPRTIDRALARRVDVDFSWRVEDDPTPVLSNLLFVGNRAMSEPVALQRLVEYYRSLEGGPRARRTARLGGARRRYAPSNSEGDTSYDTDSWLLSARGRLVTVGPAPATSRAPAEPPKLEAERFEMDGRMEGADQPPCYPVVQEARINVQSIDRLVGRPQGLITVGFTPAFVRHGFDPKLNPSEVFLSVLGPDVALDVSGQGDAVGGVAKPNALVVALSRRVGPVGGRRQPRGTTGDRADPSPGSGNALVGSTAGRLGGSRSTSTVGVEGDYDFSAALNGTFDPAEFLGGLGSAKLLGLIPLSTVLRVAAIGDAPRLLEQVAYGAARESVDDAEAMIQQALLALASGCKGFGEQLQALATGMGLRDEDLYPDLSLRLQATAAEASTTAQRLSDDGLAALARNAGPLITEVKALRRELERVFANPLPAVVQGTLELFSGAWNGLRDGVDGLVRSVPGLILGQLSTPLANLCTAMGDQRLVAELLGTDALGGDPPEASCQEILAHPGKYLHRVEQSLYAEVFSRSMLQLATWREGVLVPPLLWPAWDHRQMSAAIRSAVTGAVDAQSGRIAEETRRWLDPVIEALDRGFTDAEAELRKTANDAPVRALDQLAHLVDNASWVAQSFREHANVFRALADRDNDALRRDIEREISERMRAAGRRLVTRDIDRLRDEARTAAERGLATLTKRLMQGVERVFDAFVATADFGRIAHAAEGWCKGADAASGSIVSVLAALVDGLVGRDQELRARVEGLATAVSALRLPPASTAVGARLDGARAATHAAIRQVDASIARIKTERESLRQVASAPGVCEDPARLVGAVRRLVNLRLDVLDQLRDAVDQMLELRRLAEDAAVDAVRLTAGFQNAFWLLRNLTVVAAVHGKTWQAFRKDIAPLLTKLRDPLPLIVAEIEQLLGDIETSSVELRKDPLSADPQIAAFVDAFRRQVRTREKQLVARLAQAAAPSLARLTEPSQAALRAVASEALSFHTRIRTFATPLLTALGEQPLATLIHPDVLEGLRKAGDAIVRDEDRLRSVAGGDLEAAQSLARQWRTASGVGDLVRTLGDLAEALLRGDLRAVADLGALKTAARALEEQLRNVLLELVPSQVRLTYEWQTQIGSFPNGEKPIFAMMQSSPTDLTITADIRVDVLRGTRDAVVRGTLEPFRINLLGSIPICELQFAGASFESRNGSAPRFRTQVSNVIPGELIKFLDPLKPWLSPSGNGFYVAASLAPPAIEAGFAFASDVIPLGPIQFVNVALQVSARLPFTDDPARFRFAFASPERPFMIVAPPYGGGGYLSLVASAGRIMEFRLSFVFGAVVPIAFGPLRAHGRVVAGMYIVKSGDQQEIGALVEAVGEGNIACFGVSVSLRVVLRRSGDHELRGSAEYSFKFKLGLVSYRYRFTAGYSARNDKGPPVNSAGRLVRPDAMRSAFAAIEGGRLHDREIGPPDHVEADAVHCVATPHKSTQWNQYYTRLATELL